MTLSPMIPRRTGPGLPAPLRPASHRRSTGKRFCALAGAATGLLLASFGSRAAEVTFEPNVTSGVTYQTNPRLLLDGKRSTFGLRLTPTAKLRRKTETSDWELRTSLTRRQYTGDKLLNATDAEVAVKGRHQFERTRLDLDAGFLRDSTVATELQTTGAVLDRKQRNSVTIGPKLTRQLSDRDELFVGGSIADVRYQDAGATALIDYRYSAVFAGYTRRLNERTEATVSAVQAWFDPVGRSGYGTAQLEGSLTWRWTESTSVGARAGVVRITNDLSVAPDRSETRPLYGLWLETSGAASSWRLAAERSILPSGLGILLETDRISGRTVQQLSERDEIEASAAYLKTRAANDALAFGGSRFADVRMTARRRLTREWSAEAGAFWQWRDMTSTNRSADNLGALVGISYIWRPTVLAH